MNENNSEVNSENSSEVGSENSSEVSSEVGSENSSEASSEVGSENSSEVSSEVSSEIVVYAETNIPDDTLQQIGEMHTLCVITVAMFGTLFFIWVFDFIFKKLSHYF